MCSYLKVCSKNCVYWKICIFDSLPPIPVFSMTLVIKPFENTVGKGENAGHQHFLLFPQCFLPFPKENSIFQSNLLCRLLVLSSWTSVRICRLVQSELKCFNYPFPKQTLVFMCLQYKSLENTVGKREIACNEQILLFPQRFIPFRRTFYHFHQI